MTTTQRHTAQRLTRKRMLLAGSLTVGLGLTAACGDDANSNAPAAELQTITHIQPHGGCLTTYPIYTAEAEGFFEEEGIDMNIVSGQGSAAVLQSIASGQAQTGLPGSGPTMQANARGEHIQMFASVYPRGTFSLVAPSDSGIEGPEDLRGKIIGAGTQDGAEVHFMKTVMASVDLQEGDYDILVVGEEGAAVAAFGRGDIDAYAYAAAVEATLNNAGIPVVNITPESALYQFGNGLAATPEFIADNPEVVAGIVRAVHKGFEVGRDDPQRAIDNCADTHPAEVEDLEFARELVEVTARSMIPLEGDEWGWMPPESWERMLDDYIATGEIGESELDVETVYTNDFVPGAN